MEDPIGGFQRIRDLYVTYLETAFRIRDAGVSAERRALLERPNTFCTEPLVEPLPQYEVVDWLLHDLTNGVGCDERLPGIDATERAAFVDLVLAGLLDSTPNNDTTGRRATFPLYKHQAEMLRRGVQVGPRHRDVGNRLWQDRSIPASNTGYARKGGRDVAIAGRAVHEASLVAGFFRIGISEVRW